MKPLHRLLAAATFAASLTPAQAWQNNQSADLILGQIATEPLIDEGRDFAFDPATGKLFVADFHGGRVLRYGSQDKLLTGAPPEAVFGSNGAPSPPPGSTLTNPSGLALDSAGRLWVAGNYRIYRWDQAVTRSSGEPADGLFGAPDFVSAPYPAGDPKRLDFEMRLAADDAGNLFVSCYARNSILRFDAAAGKPMGAGPDAYFGQISFTNTTAGLSASRVSAPRDLAMRGTTLWVHDTDNRRLLRLDNAATRAAGAAFDAVAGQSGLFANDNLTLSGYSSMDISPGGILHVAGGIVITAWAGADSLSGLLPAPLFSSTFTSSNSFTSLLCESDSRVWAGASLADSQHPASAPVRRLESLPSTAAANTLGAAPPAPLRRPWQVAVDPVSGKVFVSDQMLHTVQRFSSMASLASHAPPEAVLGAAGGAGFLNLSAPTGLCLDSEGRLYVADTGNNRVVRWNNAANLPSHSPISGALGHKLASFPPTGPYNEATIVQPYGVTVDAGGTLWVLDYFLARALRFDQAALKSGDVPADGMLGKSDYADPSTSGLPGRFHLPTHIQYDSAGNLWVLDSGGVDESTGLAGGEFRIFRYDNANSKPVGAMPDNTIKFRQSDSDFGPGGELNGLAVTPDNTLWVALRSGNIPQVRRFDNATSVVTGTPYSALLGSGNSGSGAGDFGAAFGGAITGLSTDPAGNLWVADQANRRVMRFSASPPPPLPAGTAVQANRDAQGFHLSFSAAPGTVYYMDSSPDLQAWTPLAVRKALTSLETFTDPAPAGGRRYYRARSAP